MNLRDDLTRATVYAACDARDRGDREAFAAACAEVVNVHRRAPLVEHALRLGEAATAEVLAHALLAERVAELLDEVLIARRRAVLLEAEIAVLQVTA